MYVNFEIKLTGRLKKITGHQIYNPACFGAGAPNFHQKLTHYKTCFGVLLCFSTLVAGNIISYDYIILL